MVEIPIQNIYHLLCYGWDKLEERDLVDVDAQSFKDLPNLFARVLVNGLRHLFKKGLDRDYLFHQDEYRGVKGKLLLSESIKMNVFNGGKTICIFDEFDYDVLHNQILKATVRHILMFKELDSTLHEELKVLHQRFHNVSDIKIERNHFAKVKLHRNNLFYGFLLDVALIIHENLLPDPSSGNWRFKDFLQDEIKMAALFEKFIYNFYKRELSKEFTVGVELIKWNAEAISGSSLEFLPVMRTDISLTSKNRKVIIDAKFYKEAMVTRFDTEKFRSQHFYQMYAYVNNLETVDREGKLIEGILLYPTVERSFSQSYKIKEYQISFKTINLAQNWEVIERSLLQEIF